MSAAEEDRRLGAAIRAAVAGGANSVQILLWLKDDKAVVYMDDVDRDDTDAGARWRTDSYDGYHDDSTEETARRLLARAVAAAAAPLLAAAAPGGAPEPQVCDSRCGNLSTGEPRHWSGCSNNGPLATPAVEAPEEQSGERPFVETWNEPVAAPVVADLMAALQVSVDRARADRRSPEAPSGAS